MVAHWYSLSAFCGSRVPLPMNQPKKGALAVIWSLGLPSGPFFKTSGISGPYSESTKGRSLMLNKGYNSTTSGDTSRNPLRQWPTRLKL